MRIMPDDDVKADSASLFRPAESVYVVFKAAVSTENIETSVTDRSRPYPGCLCCYSIQILLTEPSYSCQEMAQRDTTHVKTRKIDVLCRVTSKYNGSHQVVAGLRRILKWVQMLIIFISFFTRVGSTLFVHKIFLQSTYSDVQVFFNYVLSLSSGRQGRYRGSHVPFCSRLRRESRVWRARLIRLSDRWIRYGVWRVTVFGKSLNFVF